MKFSCLALAATCAIMPTLGPARALEAGFDGHWAVTLVTDRGDCDRSLGWNVAVASGRIEDGGMFVTTSGHVDARGRVSLKMAKGSDMLAAGGLLLGRSGTGTWTSPTRQCSGHWSAMREG